MIVIAARDADGKIRNAITLFRRRALSMGFATAQAGRFIAARRRTGEVDGKIDG
jgi:hypothetical protein